MEALADAPTVRHIRLPLRAYPDVTSEGVSLINADDWHTAGFTGSGVKVGIIDLGFQGYNALLGIELPASVVTQCYGYACPVENGEKHGTAVAEIVHDIAPGAQLYLVSIYDHFDLNSAVTYLLSQGVQVVNHSVGWMYHAPGNGTGTVNSIVDTAVAGGIFWANSSGNYAQKHWNGNWSDSNVNNWLNFAGADEGNTFWLNVGEEVSAGLRWNDTWGSSSNDYDLYLVKSSDASIKAYSENVQDGNDNPLEVLSYVAAESTSYSLAIHKWSASGTPNFALMTFMNPNLEYQTAAGSLVHPADNASNGMMSVGAVRWSTPGTLEAFSSQGPTTDSRIKPDIVAPDGVSTYSKGANNFYGTSASSPHTAGAAALVKQAHSSYTPAQIRTFLESQAIDLGAAGKDNLYGSGRLYLPLPALSASYSSSPPTNWTANQSQSYSVVVTNTGSQTWNASGPNNVRLGIHFGSDNDGWGVGWATDQRFALPGDVAPGGSVTLPVTVTAPGVVGSYVLRHRMVKEGVAWLDQIQKINVTVY